MRLRCLQKTIFSSLTLIDHSTNATYTGVDCYSPCFEQFKDYIVIGIRSRKQDVIEVSIKKKEKSRGKD